MITIEEIQKLLVFDIETSGKYPTLEVCGIEEPKLKELWKKRCIYLRTAKEEDRNLSDDELWLKRAGLHPEYGKVICVSCSYFHEGTAKVTSYYGDNEIEILKNTRALFNKIDSLGWSICGHTIKRFDVPYLAKRMVINKMLPPSILNVWNKKPWETKFVDISEMFSFGAWQEAHTSLDLMSAVLGVESPKADLSGDKVHESYWFDGELERIKTYCENDIRATGEILMRFSVLT